MPVAKPTNHLNQANHQSSQAFIPSLIRLPLHIFAIQRKAYLTLALALLLQPCGMLAFPLFSRLVTLHTSS